jgi:hypothetical protein
LEYFWILIHGLRLAAGPWLREEALPNRGRKKKLGGPQGIILIAILFYPDKINLCLRDY